MFLHRLAVNIVFLINGVLYTSWLSRLPEIQQLYGMSHSQTGLVLLALGLGALLAMPAAGLLISRHGSHRVTAVSAILFCSLAALAPVMGTSVGLAGLLFVLGMSTGTMDVAMNAQAVVVEKRYGRPLMSSFHALFSGGMMAGAALGALFTWQSIGVTGHLWTIVGFCLAAVIWSVRHLHPEEQIHSPSTGASGFQWPTGTLWTIGVIAFCSMLGEGTMADWSTIYMREIAGADPGMAPTGLGVFSAAMMLGRILGDRARARFGDAALLIISSLTAACGTLLLVLVPSPVLAIAAMGLVGVGLSVVSPIAYSTAGSVKELPPGVGISMVTTIGYSGFLLGPPIIGFLADWQTLRASMAFVGLLQILMTVLSVRHQRRKLAAIVDAEANPAGEPSSQPDDSVSSVRKQA